MSTSTQADEELTVQEIVSDPWKLLGAIAGRLNTDWTVFYPLLLLAGSIGIGMVVTISGTGEGPTAVSTPTWANLLVNAVMPLALFLLYPIGIVAAYQVTRWVFGPAKIDALLAFAIVAGVATATKAASIIFGAVF